MPKTPPSTSKGKEIPKEKKTTFFREKSHKIVNLFKNTSKNFSKIFLSEGEKEPIPRKEFRKKRRIPP